MKIAEKVKIKTRNKEYKAIKLTFRFDWDLIEKVKTLENRKYHPDGKYWTCILNSQNLEKIKKWGFELDENLQNWENQKKKVVQDINIPGLNGELFPFQKEGVNFIELREGRALIADSMGLGKTVQSLAWLQLHPEKRPVLIVCPASMKWEWYRQAKKWLSNSKKCLVISGSMYIPDKHDIYIINYDILSKHLERLKSLNIQVLIVDEAHYIKNNRAQRTKAVKKLAKGILHIIGLTGTPILSRPFEIYNIARLIEPYCLPSFWDFVQRYCDAKHNGFGWDFSGASNTEELHRRLSNTIMIRRTKEEVLKDLPDKLRSVIPIEIENRQEYDYATRNFWAWLREKGKEVKSGEILVKIEKLKQLSVEGKLNQAIAWIKNYIETGEKLVIFCVHKKVIDRLMKEFGNIAVKIDGLVNPTERQKIVDRFQKNKKIKLFIGNIKAAGVGITLTASRTVAFLELGWTPGEHDQAEDRVHRIGQKESVNVYYLVGLNTIEEYIVRLIDKKRNILSKVLDGREVEKESLLGELIEKIKEEEKK